MIQYTQAKDTLNRFMNGMTTEEEELALTDFFLNSGDVPDEWSDYKEMFLSFSNKALVFSDEEIEAFTAENDDAAPLPDCKHCITLRSIHRIAASIAVLLATAGMAIWILPHHPDRQMAVHHAASTENELLAEKGNRLHDSTTTEGGRSMHRSTMTYTLRASAPTGHTGNQPEQAATAQQYKEADCRDSASIRLNMASNEMCGYDAIMKEITEECNRNFAILQESANDDARNREANVSATQGNAAHSANYNYASTFEIPTISAPTSPEIW